MNTTMSTETKFNSDLLANLIAQDREEIRIIKNRIYTTIQIFIGASFAVTAFFIEKSMKDGNINLTCDVKTLIILSNVLLLLIAWVIFYFQNKDLHFVRCCLERREKRLKDAGFDYFENIPEVMPGWCEGFLNTLWPTDFPNDGLLVIPMYLLSFVYIAVMAVAALI